ncbi:MAG TPA: M56 family metallopeptidase [Armatimonadota bacterium]|jgi:hypothetical protein
MSLKLGSFLPFLMNAAVRGTLLLVAAALLNLVLRRAPAAVRHAVWLVALTSLLLLPLFARWFPPLNVPVPPRLSAAIMDRLLESPDFTLTAENAPASPGRPALPFDFQRLMVGLPDRPEQAAPKPRAPWWIAGVVIAWLGGTVLALGRTAAGLRAIGRMARLCVPIEDGPLTESAVRVAGMLGLRQPIRLVRGAPDMAGIPPMTWGFRRPVVFLPAEAGGWPEERVTSTLLHEMAHIRRRDWLTQMLTQMTCALYWFHPLVWWAHDRMRTESEQSSDDRVIAAGISAPDYAGILVETARGIRGRCAASPATVAMNMVRRPRIESRLRAVLDRGIPHNPATRRALLGAAVAVSAILIPVAAMGPMLMVGDAYISGLPKTTVVRAVNGTAALPNGVTVTLAGISDAKASGRSWWSADGRPMSAEPVAIDWSPMGTPLAGSPSRWRFPRETVVQLTHATDADISTKAELAPNPALRCEWNARLFASPMDPVRRSETATEDNRVVGGIFGWWERRLTLRYAVAAGPWHTAAEVGPGLGTSRTDGSGRIVFTRLADLKDSVPIIGVAYTKTPPMRTVWRPCFSVVDDLGDVDRRIVVVDRRGREFPLQAFVTSYPGSRVRTHGFLCTDAGKRMLDWRFHLDGVTAMRLETRQFQWAEFSGIHLSPDGSAKVAATPSSRNADSRTEPTPPHSR